MATDYPLKRTSSIEPPWRTTLPADRIGITAETRVVTRPGHVGTWREREMATGTAWAARGRRAIRRDTVLA